MSSQGEAGVESEIKNLDINKELNDKPKVVANEEKKISAPKPKKEPEVKYLLKTPKVGNFHA